MADSGKSTGKTKRRFSYRFFKPYKGKDEFKVHKLAKEFLSFVSQLTSNMPRSYKQDIGKDFYELARNVLWKTRKANTFILGSRQRYEKQMEIVEDLENLCDLFDPLEKLRLITPAQNGELSKKADEMKFQYEVWFDSDRRRIKEEGIEDKAADIRNQKSCWG